MPLHQRRFERTKKTKRSYNRLGESVVGLSPPSRSPIDTIDLIQSKDSRIEACWLQGEAEAGLERLHQCADMELNTYLNEDGSQDEFNNFITKLAGLTSVVIQRIVKQIVRNIFSATVNCVSYPYVRQDCRLGGFYDKANVKKGPWSPEEDEKLKDYIQPHGIGGNWIALPQKAGLRRCGKTLVAGGK
ncbi:hypothetical protein L1987_43376 [Smallanthus sonchifolius]|uniref:Uncharacterized protein n=1 Tax=Smallanthus sonchifolius TaxID=185202 RepID=A0ACB9GML6_9ASTR|nr:hypothetical protein L1987_43376 [Smallanthus sonchifolius]